MARRERKRRRAPGQLSLGLIEDPDAICDLLVLELRRGKDVRLVREMDLCQGTARIDLAAVGDHLEGFEIKSDRDDLRRLPAQADVYGRVFDRVTLVTSERHVVHAQSQVPEWWGLAVVSPESCRIESLRPAENNPRPDPSARVRLLWRDETAAALYTRTGRTRNSSRRVLWRELSAIASPDEMRELVCRTLRSRTGWRAAG